MFLAVDLGSGLWTQAWLSGIHPQTQRLIDGWKHDPCQNHQSSSLDCASGDSPLLLGSWEKHLQEERIKSVRNQKRWEMGSRTPVALGLQVQLQKFSLAFYECLSQKLGQMESVSGSTITINSIVTYHYIYSWHQNSKVSAILLQKGEKSGTKWLSTFAQGHTEVSGRAPT